MIDTHDWTHRLQAVRPRQTDENTDYIQTTTRTLPQALRDLWSTGITAEQFFEEVETALENFVDGVA